MSFYGITTHRTLEQLIADFSVVFLNRRHHPESIKFCPCNLRMRFIDFDVYGVNRWECVRELLPAIISNRYISESGYGRALIQRHTHSLQCLISRTITTKWTNGPGSAQFVFKMFEPPLRRICCSISKDTIRKRTRSTLTSLERSRGKPQTAGRWVKRDWFRIEKFVRLCWCKQSVVVKFCSRL